MKNSWLASSRISTRRSRSSRFDESSLRVPLIVGEHTVDCLGTFVDNLVHDPVAFVLCSHVEWPLNILSHRSHPGKANRQCH